MHPKIQITVHPYLPKTVHCYLPTTLKNIQATYRQIQLQKKSLNLSSS